MISRDKLKEVLVFYGIDSEKVVNNNATKVEKNTYIWNINKNNLSNINMEVDFNNKEVNNKNTLIILGVACLLIVVGYFLYHIYKYKLVKNDSI